MAETLTSTALFSIVLTLGAYELGIFLQKKLKSSICNPILIAVIVVIAVLALIGVSPKD